MNEYILCEHIDPTIFFCVCVWVYVCFLAWCRCCCWAPFHNIFKVCELLYSLKWCSLRLTIKSIIIWQTGRMCIYALQFGWPWWAPFLRFTLLATGAWMHSAPVSYTLVQVFKIHSHLKWVHQLDHSDAHSSEVFIIPVLFYLWGSSCIKSALLHIIWWAANGFCWKHIQNVRCVALDQSIVNPKLIPAQYFHSPCIYKTCLSYTFYIYTAAPQGNKIETTEI